MPDARYWMLDTRCLMLGAGDWLKQERTHELQEVGNMEPGQGT